MEDVILQGGGEVSIEGICHTTGGGGRLVLREDVILQGGGGAVNVRTMWD